MDFFSLIEELSPEYGPAGFEDRVRDLLWQKLTPLCDETWTDTMGNLIGVKRSVQPDAKKLLLDAQREADALLALYNLQQEYAAGNLDGCRLTLQEISDQGLAELLPDTAPDGITAPAQRYLELREAILNS